MSDASREMTNALLDSTEAAFVSDVAKARGLEPARVRELVDEAPSSAEELLAAKLIDEIDYYEDVVEGADVVEQQDWEAVDASSLGVKPEATFALISGSGMVVTGSGEITPTGSRVMAADTFVDAVREAIDDTDVTALLVRIDSPGGSPLASDLMWRALRDARAAGKPVVVSMSDVAASGGYYVACAADTIVSQPSTLTGSIGVFVIRPSLGGLLEKAGISVETMQRGARADLLFGSQPLTAGAREVLKKDVEGVYEQFVARVAEGRGMEPDEVKKIGGGRVWTGAQALEIGLVDELGGLYEAAVAAKKAVGLEPDADRLAEAVSGAEDAGRAARAADARRAGAGSERSAASSPARAARSAHARDAAAARGAAAGAALDGGAPLAGRARRARECARRNPTCGSPRNSRWRAREPRRRPCSRTRPRSRACSPARRPRS